MLTSFGLPLYVAETAGLVVLWTRSPVSGWLAGRLLAQGSGWAASAAKAVTCPLCFGTWVGAGIGVLNQVGLGGVAESAVATAFIAWCLGSLVDLVEGAKTAADLWIAEKSRRGGE